MKLLQTRKSERQPQKPGLLFSLLTLLILVEVLTVFAVLAAQRFATERALREYTHELLTTVVDETRENVAAYLRRAQDSVSLAAHVLEAGLLSMERSDQLERHFLEQLRVVPQIDGVFFGDRHGDFVFTKRDDQGAKSGFLTKIIRTSLPVDRRVTLIDRDGELIETARRHDPEDHYDPRTRPWYTLASDSRDEVWTDPYIFYTSQRPGLTVARAVRDSAGQFIGAVGADIELLAVSEFLKSQRVGRSGAAFIIYSNGDVLAHPDESQLTQRGENGDLRLKTLSELDPVTAEAGARLDQRFPDLAALGGTHYDRFEAGNRRYLSTFVPLLSHGRDQWVMGVYAPEDELAVKIREGQRESIFLGVAMSLLVVTAAVLIGLIMLRPIHALQREAAEDPLTGLLNRRSFDKIVDKQLTVSARNREPLSAVMIDIDRFKPVNDQHGHAVGDEVLQVVARRISRGLSDHDALSRYGGEEFAVVLPRAPLAQALQIAERLRELVSSEPIKTSVGPLHVSISLGVAEADTANDSIAELLDRADRGLLAAKREGRNRVVAQPS